MGRINLRHSQCRRAPEQRIDLRIGINVGDIIIDGEVIFSDGVNVAARLQTLAEPGGIASAASCAIRCSTS
jgi:class 3 adenylate cyclase